MKKIILGLTVGTCMIFGNPLFSMAQEQKNLIGVATIFEDAGWQTQKLYFEELIGPALDMEFIYSEKINNANELEDFMSQAIAMGCRGIINFVTEDEAVARGAVLAEEEGIWYVTQNSMINEEVAELEHNLGHVGASVSGMEASYHELVKELIETDGRKSFFIYTGAAAGGDRGEGAASHFYSVKGMLEAIAESYDLQYEAPVEELINNHKSSVIETGREDVRIYLSSENSIVTGIEQAREQLKESPYDTLIAVTSYTSFTNIVANAEKNYGENIMIVATVSDDSMAQAGFEKTDQFGDSVLHAAVINPLSIADAKCSFLLAKGLEGKENEVKENGHTIKYEIEPWICDDGVKYLEIKKAIEEQVEDLLKKQ